MSIITLTFVITNVINGFVRQKLLLTTTDFHFLFILWYKHRLIHNCFIFYIFVVYIWRFTWNLILIIYVDTLNILDS